MDIFHDNAMLAGVRQMLGAFAKQYIRPVAMQHDRDESMPWALMKQATAFGMTQTAVVDGRKALTGKDDDDSAGSTLVSSSAAIAEQPRPSSRPRSARVRCGYAPSSIPPAASGTASRKKPRSPAIVASFPGASAAPATCSCARSTTARRSRSWSPPPASASWRRPISASNRAIGWPNWTRSLA